jgi:very-short-patch-repair endonuclease
MRYTDIDQRIAAIAARQHGAFTREQAFTAGASDRFVTRRLAERHWVRPASGVYALASSPGTWRRQCKLAELSIDGSAIAGLAAAAIHDLDGFRPGPIELCAPANSHRRSPLAEVHRYAGALTTTVDGIRLTTIAQTLFDLAGRCSPLRIERALDTALVARVLSLADLDERRRFYEGSRRPGTPAMCALLEERSADGWQPAESELEQALHSVLDRLPSRPRVVRQAALQWRSPQPGRVDVLLPDHGLIVEADGRRWHTRVEDFDRDRWRDNEAVAHGLRVQRFTWVHLHALVDDTIALIERTLQRAA